MIFGCTVCCYLLLSAGSVGNFFFEYLIFNFFALLLLSSLMPYISINMIVNCALKSDGILFPTLYYLLSALI